MIISLNPAIFKTQNSEIQSILAKILVKMIENNHFIDANSISTIFFDDNNKYVFDENEIAKSHLSKTGKQNLKDYIEKKIRQPITKIYINHLTHITIGTNPGEIHPTNAYNILTERSKIIVENGINDGKFIKGICQKYTSSKINKQRRSIYSLIDMSIKKGIIEFDNAGGLPAILNTTKRWIDDLRYKYI